MKCGNRYEKLQYKVLSHPHNPSDAKYNKVSDSSVAGCVFIGCCVAIATR